MHLIRPEAECHCCNCLCKCVWPAPFLCIATAASSPCVLTLNLQVRNRTQDEVDQKLSAEAALQKEQDFFDGTNLTEEEMRASKELRSLPDHTKGTKQLINKLVQIQQEGLREGMPKLKKRVSRKWSMLSNF